MANTIKYLTQAEMKRLFDAIENPRDKAIFLLAYRHGLRASEVGMLNVSDIDWESNRIQIGRLKGSISGVHVMKADEVKLLRSYLDARDVKTDILFPSNQRSRINRVTLHLMMKKYGALAAIPGDKRHFHCLKHSIATHLLDAGARVDFVQEYLGHASILNTMIYARITNQRREEETRQLLRSDRVV